MELTMPQGKGVRIRFGRRNWVRWTLTQGEHKWKLVQYIRLPQGEDSSGERIGIRCDDIIIKPKADRSTRLFTRSGCDWIMLVIVDRGWHHEVCDISHLCIRQRKCGTLMHCTWAALLFTAEHKTHPRASKYMPFVDFEQLADLLDVLNEIPGGILL